MRVVADTGDQLGRRKVRGQGKKTLGTPFDFGFSLRDPGSSRENPWEKSPRLWGPAGPFWALLGPAGPYRAFPGISLSFPFLPAGAFAQEIREFPKLPRIGQTLPKFARIGQGNFQDSRNCMNNFRFYQNGQNRNPFPTDAGPSPWTWVGAPI